ncbi:flagellar basal body L-ring protein FlgH [Alkalilimnicola ehrlichii MLHE-1]|uniref:Flagellar L-ring protein n=1 Tax=Alkalilimnicola ehrlichii (strain ATCC BAA-1101 / DSM 17681 / MLHE-1) TaxID=187272 RepID=Q0AA84_ALKEH|nr:flagellar basal body L-ring protein FlgH [Alkalilimnicola ehrlichii]ABI56253.1 flagellar L-ring protein [Alkalilimnicola ehrlichii MLHE-1]
MNHRLIKWLFMALAVTALAGCAGMPDQAPKPLPLPEIAEPERQNNGAIYQAGGEQRLFEDRRSRRVGDVITVLFEENTDASKSNSSSMTKSSSAELPAPTVAGRGATRGGVPLEFDAQADRSFSGDGAADQSNQLTGTLTAIVTDTMPNGYLVIEGQKKLTLNQGAEYVTISGIVRPDDVGADNTVSSLRVANAQIAYTGTGALADSNRPGWLTRVFNSRWWPL